MLLESKTWKGHGKQTADQHLWHLVEGRLETEEVTNPGLMAISGGQDRLQQVLLLILLRSESVLSQNKLHLNDLFQTAVLRCRRTIVDREEVFACIKPVMRRSCSRSGTSKTCQIIQVNFKLATPEDEAGMVRSEDVEAAPRTKCTCALLLATRSGCQLSN